MIRSTPRLVCIVALAALALACDKKKDESELEAKKTKSVFDVKQSAKTEMSEAELEEARRKAGFKSHEERLEEAKAEYDKMERGYIKPRLAGYRDLMKEVKAKLDDVGKAAPKWAGADAAFEKWNGKYKEDVKAIKKKHGELTENGSRGGNLEVEITALLEGWDALNGELNAKSSEAETFKTSLEALTTKIGEIEKQLDEIEKDDTIVPEEPEGDGKKGDANRADDKKADAKKADDKKADDKGDAKKGDAKDDAKE